MEPQLGNCVVCGKQLELRKYYDKKGYFKGYGQSLKKVTCSRACTNIYRAGMDLEERFWSKVDRSQENDCWPFIGMREKQGYGRMKWNGTKELAHRIAWSLANEQPIPEINVLHTCDNPPCCNPKHLFLGTHDDNMSDMVTKGRSSHKFGERNGRAILTEDQIREIRQRYENDKISQSSLADEYGINQTTIGRIVNKTKWPHII